MVLGEWMRKPRLFVISESWTLIASTLDMRNYSRLCYLESTCHSQLMLHAPQFLLCPKKNQPKYIMENKSSLEEEEQTSNSCSVFIYNKEILKLMVCLLLAVKEMPWTKEKSWDKVKTIWVAAPFHTRLDVKEPFTPYSFQTTKFISLNKNKWL